MTITVISERPMRAGELTTPTGTDDRETRMFICRTTDPLVVGKDLETASGLPKKYDRHPRDPRLFLLSISYKQHEDAPTYLDVTCDYSIPTSEQQPPAGGGDGSPVSLKPEVTWDGTTYQKVARGASKDISQAVEKGTVSEGIVTSAGEPYDPPFEIDEDYPTVHIRRAERVYSAIRILDYSGSINSDPFVIDGEAIEKYKAKMGSIRIGAVEYDDNGAPYRWVEYPIIINYDTWILRPLDYGSYYIDFSDGNKKKPFLSDDKQTAITGMLNGSGAKLITGDPPVFLEFHVRREKPFQALQLPSVSI